MNEITHFQMLFVLLAILVVAVLLRYLIELLYVRTINLNSCFKVVWNDDQIVRDDKGNQTGDNKLPEDPVQEGGKQEDSDASVIQNKTPSDMELLQSAPAFELSVAVGEITMLEQAGDPLAVKRLIEILDDKCSPVRDRACDALLRLGSHEAAGAISSYLADMDRCLSENFRNHTASEDEHRDGSCRNIVDNTAGEQEGAFENYFSNRSYHVKTGAAQALETMRATGSAQQLLDAAGEVGWGGMRRTVLDALAELDNEEVEQAAISRLESMDRNIRRAAVFALGRIGSRRAIEALMSLLRDEDGELAAEATSILVGHGCMDVVEPLMNAVSELDAELRGQPVEGVSQHDGDAQAAAEALEAAVRSESSIVRACAVSHLSAEKPDARKTLLSALKDTDPYVRSRALNSIGRARDKAAWDNVVSALSDANPDVRYSAVKALERIASPGWIETTDVASMAEKDPDRHVRIAAAKAVASTRAE